MSSETRVEHELNCLALREKIELEEELIKKLVHSNTLLMLELAGDSPDDLDFLDAISENKGVMKKKRTTIETYTRMLVELDSAYRAEQRAVEDGLSVFKTDETSIVCVVEDAAVLTSVNHPHPPPSSVGGLYL